MTNTYIISTLFQMNKITEEEIFEYVCTGKISTSDYKYITSKDCPELPIEIAKNIKIEELSNNCNKIILEGFYSAADGIEKLYDFDLENQVNLSVYKNNIIVAQILGQDVPPISYYAKGEGCHDYTKEQFLQLVTDGESFKSITIQKYKALKKMVLEFTGTQTEIENINWDTEIPIN